MVLQAVSVAVENAAIIIRTIKRFIGSLLHSWACGVARHGPQVHQTQPAVKPMWNAARHR
jgi:hypothetical protein